jgi:glycosyltransferase involved in cell wall biosynthesis
MKKKILFILPNLKAGGAERVISFLATKFHENKHEVTLLVLGFEKDKVFETGSLTIVYLNRPRLLFSVFDTINFIKKTKPSIVLSTISHVNIFMSLISVFFKNTKFFARESSVLSVRTDYGGYKSRLLKKMISSSYKKLDAIICQSQDMKNDFIENFDIDKNKCIVIGNPITMHLLNSNKKSNTNIKRINFITVGRLSEEKGHSRIIKGLSKIVNYDFHYTIVGDGPLVSQIKNEVEDNNIKNKVTFIKYTSKILEEVYKNDYFLQGSYVEGFPNAVLESCSIGVPIIAFNCPGGTKDIIINGENGFFVKDQNDFEALLIRLDAIRKPISEMVKKHVWKNFESKEIVLKYDDLFTSI